MAKKDLKIVPVDEVKEEQVPDDGDTFVPPDLSYLGDWEPKRLSLGGDVRLIRLSLRAASNGYDIPKLYSRWNKAKDQDGELKVILREVVLGLEDEDALAEIEYLMTEFFSMILGRSHQWVKQNWDKSLALQALAGWFMLERLGEVFASGSLILNFLLPRTRNLTPASANGS